MTVKIVSDFEAAFLLEENRTRLFRKIGRNYSGTVLFCPLRLLTTAVIETMERILSRPPLFLTSVSAQKNPTLQFISTVHLPSAS